MFPSKQKHKFDYFICYHLESGWHVTRPNRSLFSREERARERGCRPLQSLGQLLLIFGKIEIVAGYLKSHIDSSVVLSVGSEYEKNSGHWTLRLSGFSCRV